MWRVGQQHIKDAESRIGVGDAYYSNSQVKMGKERKLGRGLAYLNLTIKPPWAPQRWIDRIGSVRRPDHNNSILPNARPAFFVLILFHSIQEGKQRGDDAFFHLPAGAFFSPRHQCIHFVDDNNARGTRAGLSKHGAQFGFSFTVVGTAELGTIDYQDPGVRRRGDGAGKMCFTSPRWAVQ